MVDEAGEAQGAAPAGEVEELPTMPPAPRRDKATLRWATPGPGIGGASARRLLPAPVTAPGPADGRPTAPVFVPTGPVAAPSTGPVPVPQVVSEGAGRRRRVTALLVLLGGLLVLAGTAVVVVWRVGQDKVLPLRPPVTSPLKPSSEELFENLLGVSATAQTLVRTVVDGACRTAAPHSGARAGLVAQIGRADALRRYVLTDVDEQQAALLKMPGGRALSADLLRATGASIRADAAYAAWLGDLQATGCYSAPTNDIHYRAAAQASVAADHAKVQLAAGWASVASRFGLRSWTAADL